MSNPTLDEIYIEINEIMAAHTKYFSNSEFMKLTANEKLTYDLNKLKNNINTQSEDEPEFNIINASDDEIVKIVQSFNAFDNETIVVKSNPPTIQTKKSFIPEQINNKKLQLLIVDKQIRLKNLDNNVTKYDYMYFRKHIKYIDKAGDTNFTYKFFEIPKQSINNFINQYMKKDNNLYEIIPANHKVKLYFDLEEDLEAEGTLNIEYAEKQKLISS